MALISHQQICNNEVTKDPIASHVKRFHGYFLWNSNASFRILTFTRRQSVWDAVGSLLNIWYCWVCSEKASCETTGSLFMDTHLLYKMKNCSSDVYFYVATHIGDDERLLLRACVYM